MAKLYLRIRNAFINEDGQDLAEYALLIGLIALVVLAAVTLLGGELSDLFDRIATEVSGWGIAE